MHINHDYHINTILTYYSITLPKVLFNQVHQQPFDQVQYLQKNILVCIQYVNSMHVPISNHSFKIYTTYKY